MKVNELLNILNNSNILLIIGLIFQLVGGVLISIEAFGIKDYIDYINEGSEHDKRRALLELNAIFNNISVFTFVNLIWFLTLLFYLEIPLKGALCLFLLGYYIWKIIIILSNIMLKHAQSMIPKVSSNDNFFKCLVMFPIVLITSLIYLFIALISLFIEYGLNIPFRYISEKYVSKIILKLFRYACTIINNMKHSKLKKPIILGLLLVFVGFIYQFLGTIL